MRGKIDCSGNVTDPSLLVRIAHGEYHGGKMDTRIGHRFSIEFLKSEMYTGFVCTACGATFPVPPNTAPDFDRILAGLIENVNSHHCAETLINLGIE